jgi:hypothetical protein
MPPRGGAMQLTLPRPSVVQTPSRVLRHDHHYPPSGTHGPRRPGHTGRARPGPGRPRDRICRGSRVPGAARFARVAVFVDVTAAAATAVGFGLRGEGGWRAPYRLLHGLASIGSGHLARYPMAHLARLRSDVARDTDPAEPEWLAPAAPRTPTGRVWRLQDSTGGRLAVIAEFAYSGTADRSAYLFDIDVCTFDTLVGAGAYDHEEEAAAQWRDRCGGTADGAVLTSVDGGRRPVVAGISVGWPRVPDR